MTTSSLSKITTEKDTVSTQHSTKELSANKKIFNFNPQETDVSAFLSSVLLEMLGANKLAELREKQKELNSIFEKKDAVDPDEKKQLEHKTIELQSELRSAAAEKITEKLDFTCTGFDISKKSIPSDLATGSKNILEDKTLSLLAKRYLFTQVLSIFKITTDEFDSLSRKASKDKSANEKLKYNRILTLWEEVTRIEKFLKDPDKTHEKLTTSLDKIKAMGKKETKIYDLLSPFVSLPSEKSTSTEKHHRLAKARRFITLFRETLEEIFLPTHKHTKETSFVSFVKPTPATSPTETYRPESKLNFFNNNSSFFGKTLEKDTLLDEKTENKLQSTEQAEEKAPERSLYTHM